MRAYHVSLNEPSDEMIERSTCDSAAKMDNGIDVGIGETDLCNERTVANVTMYEREGLFVIGATRDWRVSPHK